MNSSEQEILASGLLKVWKAAWTDEEVRQRLAAGEAMAVLEQHGVTVPEGVTVTITLRFERPPPIPEAKEPASLADLFTVWQAGIAAGTIALSVPIPSEIDPVFCGKKFPFCFGI